MNATLAMPSVTLPFSGSATAIQELPCTCDELHARGIASLVRVGLGAILVLVLGVLCLVALLPLAGAVIAPGEVTVEGNVKEISHPFGGVAAAILVKDGDHVRAGDPLIRLDSTVVGALASYAGLGVDQLEARAARLRAVQEGRAAISFPAELMRRAGKADVAATLRDERASLALARRARGDQLRQLQARIVQTRADAQTYESQIHAFAEQQGFIQKELEQTRDLYRERLTTLDRLNALERSAVGVRAQREAALAGYAQAKARIGELEVQMSGLESQTRSEAALELGQVEAALAERRKERAESRDRADRSIIRAPLDGVVDKLKVRTLGSVVPAGESLLEIVPRADSLVIRAHIRPTDIDQVLAGGVAHVRFTALNMRTTPEVAGKVDQVAADRSVDPLTGAAYYPVLISISDDELGKIGNARISVGMPVEVFVQTQQKTILQYIIRPLSDQLRRALQE